jgi:hypothetical protein
MSQSKEQFMEQRQWSVTMSEDVYCMMPEQIRRSFKSERAFYPDEHDRLYESDENYKSLYTKYRKAKKELEEYKYNKRHGQLPSGT